MNKIIVQHHKTPYGELIIGSFNEKLCLCDWRYRKKRSAIDVRLSKGLGADVVKGDNKVVQSTIQQLNEYFNNERKTFDVPLLMIGTDFQKTVWKELQQVPFGQTSSYAKLAEKIGNKKAIRAVANANGANAMSILIPCHRIIGSDGSLLGYAGGVNAKKKLLQLENNLFV